MPMPQRGINWHVGSSSRNISSTKRNLPISQGYQIRSSITTKDVEHKRVNYTSQANNNLQRSVSAENVVVRSRGFKPSDRHDPAKRNFLEHLTSKILHFEMDSGQARPINLEKLLNPPMDSSDLLLNKHKKMYASSCFYAPTHPTVEDQVELARRISYSLSDVKNMKSKGQSMYVNRKKRSVKWIHDGNGDDGEEEPPSTMHKDKVPLKCMMNPNGKVMDIHGIQAMGEEVNIGTSPANAGKLFDIVRDLNNQKGRGAEIFAKRRKRSEKWVVDKEQCQTPPTPSSYPKAPSFLNEVDMSTNENSKFTSLTASTTMPTSTTGFQAKPFYNPFALDLSLESVTPSVTGSDQRRGSFQSDNSTSGYTEVKKIYLREVAVGTEPEYPVNGDCGVFVEKSKRVMSFDGYSNVNDNNNTGNGRSNMNNRRNKCFVTNGNNNGNGRDRFGNNRINQQSTNRRVVERHRNHHNHRNNYNNNNNRNYDSYECYEDVQHQQIDEIQDETDYTPVPVKQLIKEFEKTCRPVFQYKQISPNAIPIVQQCHTVDNDISRFFETSRATGNYDNRQQQQQQQQQLPSRGSAVVGGMPKRSVNANKTVNNGNGRVNYTNGNGYSKGMGYGGQPMAENLMKRSEIYEEYDSTDDEIDDSFGDSDEEVNYRRTDVQRIMYNDTDKRFFNNGDYASATSNGTNDEYEMYVRQFDECSELFEAPPGFGNADDENCDKNGDDETNDGDARVLAMVASQEDILDTIKHLRNTPVLENLVGAPSPHFFADVGNGKPCEPTYQGPKINSFNTLTNYNTAPRGWDQSQTFYRPVTFGKQQEQPIAYSDF